MALAYPVPGAQRGIAPRSRVLPVVIVDTTPPTVDLTSSATFRMSRIPGWDAYSYTFTANEASQAWKIKSVPAASSPENVGTLIESGGAIGANETVTGTLTDDEVIAATGSADGVYVIKFFAQDLAGNWST